MFSLQNWVNLRDRQSKHTIFDCQGCLQNETWRDALAMFPQRSFLQQQKAKTYGLIDRKILKEKTRQTLNKLNKEFYENYHTSFTTQIKRCINSPNVIDLAKSIKADIENQWQETCVER